MKIVSIDPNKWRMQLAEFDCTSTCKIFEPPALSTLPIGEVTAGFGEKRTAGTKHKIGLCPSPGDPTPGAQRLYDIWFLWAQRWCDKNLRGPADWLVIEKPDHASHIPGMGRGGKVEFDGKVFKSGSPNALTRGLCDLSVVSASVVLGASAAGVLTRLVEPREWKGNKRKTTTFKEVEAVFGGDWANANLYHTKGKDSGKPNNDLSDAVGIGLWWIDRLVRYKNGKHPEALQFEEHHTSVERRAARAARKRKPKTRRARGGAKNG